MTSTWPGGDRPGAGSAWPGGGPAGAGAGGAGAASSGPAGGGLAGGGPAGSGAGGGPAGGGWATAGANGDAAIPAGSGRGAGERLARVEGAWPDQSGGAWDEWMSDDRPAAASIPGELFPERHARAVQAESPVDAGLAAIKAHDPNFDLEQFTEQVQRVFFLVEQGWSERRPEVARQVMADDLWSSHRAQVQAYIDAHKRNMLDYLAVSNIWPVAARSDQRFDTVTVRIVAASTDYDVDEASGHVLRGDTQVKPWEEDWTFRRSSTARTQEGGTTLGSKCPNCGAALDTDLAGVCRYCKVSVTSGTQDWVLARISQVG